MRQIIVIYFLKKRRLQTSVYRFRLQAHKIRDTLINLEINKYIYIRHTVRCKNSERRSQKEKGKRRRRRRKKRRKNACAENFTEENTIRLVEEEGEQQSHVFEMRERAYKLTKGKQPAGKKKNVRNEHIGARGA